MTCQSDQMETLAYRVLLAPATKRERRRVAVQRRHEAA